MRINLRGIILPLLVATVVALVFTSPIFRNFFNWGIQDWDQHLFYHAVPRHTLVEYHQVPLWNPYYCGGTVMLANPQSRFLTPSFGLILLFGTVKGIKLEIVLHLIIGLLGMYLLAGHFKMDPLPASLSAGVYMLSSMYALNLTVGMTWFLSVAFIPWALLCFLKGFEQWKFMIVCALFLVLIYLGGGAYPLSITMLFFGLFCLLNIRRFGSVRTAGLFGFLVVFTLCLGAVKFLPSIEFLHQHPRKISDYSGYSVKVLLHSLLDRDQSLAAVYNYSRQEGFWDGMSNAMDENGMYIGIIPFLLFLVGLGLNWRSQWRLTLLLIFFLWLGFGNRIPVSLWELLHRLPVYDSMRVAQRFRIVFMLIMALFVGFGFQTVIQVTEQKIGERTLLQVLQLVVPAIILLDLIGVNSGVFKEAFPISPLHTVRQSQFYQIYSVQDYDANGGGAQKSWRSSWSALYPSFLSNIGIIGAYESANVPRHAIPKGSDAYQGEVFFQETTGKLSIDFWSPNRVKVNIRAKGNGYLVLNQNYYSGWKIKGDRPREVEPYHSLLAVRVTPADKHIEFYYSPLSFQVGRIVTGLTILAGILLWFSENAALVRKMSTNDKR